MTLITLQILFANKPFLYQWYFQKFLLLPSCLFSSICSLRCQPAFHLYWLLLLSCVRDRGSCFATSVSPLLLLWLAFLISFPWRCRTPMCLYFCLCLCLWLGFPFSYHLYKETEKLSYCTENYDALHSFIELSRHRYTTMYSGDLLKQHLTCLTLSSIFVPVTFVYKMHCLTGQSYLGIFHGVKEC